MKSFVQKLNSGLLWTLIIVRNQLDFLQRLLPLWIKLNYSCPETYLGKSLLFNLGLALTNAFNQIVKSAEQPRWFQTNQ